MLLYKLSSQAANEALEEPKKVSSTTSYMQVYAILQGIFYLYKTQTNCAAHKVSLKDRNKA